MRNWIYIACIALFGLMMTACEEEYIPSDSIYEKEIVIEAYIEKSTRSIPTYAIITYSLPFYSSFGIDVVNNSFVRNAEVIVDDGMKQYRLIEICSNDIPDTLRDELIANLGFNPDSFKTNVCVYADLFNEINPQEGVLYKLRVVKDADTFYSSTVIPKLIPIDSFWFEKPPGKNMNDTFAQMNCIISDLPGQKDFYRYFTAHQGEPLRPGFNSVTNDVFFDGQRFKFFLSARRGEDEAFDDNSGLFRRGDSIRLKWCTIPETHFDFWLTLETSRARQGPFASYVRIDGNIDGGLGFFGGQNCMYIETVVPK